MSEPNRNDFLQLKNESDEPIFIRKSEVISILRGTSNSHRKIKGTFIGMRNGSSYFAAGDPEPAFEQLVYGARLN